MLYLNSGKGGSSTEDVQGTLEAAAGTSSKRQSPASEEEEEMELRRGPWTVEEDLLLINYIAKHGEGRWNFLALRAGLRRTGKSCRLRWLNYLRPDVRRGNITAEEQLLILELHSRWGNRWSKIAQYLPGRTDNEIKNYWRTRVQKHAKQLQCDVDSKKFKDAVRYLWMPRLAERVHAPAASAGGAEPTRPAVATAGRGRFGSPDVDVDVDVPALSSGDSARTATAAAAPFCSPPPPAELDDVMQAHGALRGEAIGLTRSAEDVPEIFEGHCVMDSVMQQCDWGGEFGGTTTTALWSMEDIWSMQ